MIEPAAPAWMRETLLDAGAKVSAYPLKDELLIMFSVSGFDAPGMSIKGGAVMGQMSYRFDGEATLIDHPKYREGLKRLVAHALARIRQMNLARGG